MSDTATLEVTGRAALVDVLAAGGGPLRVQGRGTHEALLPAPPTGATVLSLAPMRRIVRLEADDLTATVEPGLPLAELRAALAELDLELPCSGADGNGSAGGLFAAGLHGPPAPLAPSPRSLLLGIEGVLADGTAFKSGAPVVKNVAGFDVHKAFVGSRGRLFATTLLHVKLRVRPRARAAFRIDGLRAADAVARLHELRIDRVPAAALWLRREASGACSLSGLLEGSPRWVATRRAALGAGEVPPDELPATAIDAPAPGRTLLVGALRPRAIGALLDALPAGATARIDGCGGAVVDVDEDAARALLVRASAEGAFERLGGDPARRGDATPRPARVEALEEALRAALDPRGRLW